ncbi:hypothetical protein PMAYCL1PPCAC_08269 [Pristionchus mayeri]|uniref:Uncharacterized protein n=1 Tax=Pristionchus mayeri TaxID=1317129 RepID=A0AAN5CD01_9BILA|nr:hypothetical protein PMAYCL1PPCAC_08269 [Pristionchus mayeri]
MPCLWREVSASSRLLPFVPPRGLPRVRGSSSNSRDRSGWTGNVPKYYPLFEELIPENPVSKSDSTILARLRNLLCGIASLPLCLFIIWSPDLPSLLNAHVQQSDYHKGCH